MFIRRILLALHTMSYYYSSLLHTLTVRLLFSVQATLSSSRANPVHLCFSVCLSVSLCLSLTYKYMFCHLVMSSFVILLFLLQTPPQFPPSLFFLPSFCVSFVRAFLLSVYHSISLLLAHYQLESVCPRVQLLSRAYYVLSRGVQLEKLQTSIGCHDIGDGATEMKETDTNMRKA